MGTPATLSFALQSIPATDALMMLIPHLRAWRHSLTLTAMTAFVTSSTPITRATASTSAVLLIEENKMNYGRFFNVFCLVMMHLFT